MSGAKGGETDEEGVRACVDQDEVMEPENMERSDRLRLLRSLVKNKVAQGGEIADSRSGREGESSERMIPNKN